MTMRRLTATMVVALVAALPAAAQEVVGKLPAQSVLQDLNDGQRIGVFAGWLTTGRDPVGIRAKSTALMGVRYDLLMGAPAYLSMRLYGMSSTHDVVDPNLPVARRFSGTSSARQVGADASVEVSLTGERTWHGVQPLTRLGLGFIAGVGNSFDAGAYKPGVSVVYLYGFGARFPMGKNADFRVDANWMVYQVRYPQSFRLTSAADTIPVRGSGSLTPLTSNRALTASWTWGIFR
jgi:hypothetical protein